MVPEGTAANSQGHHWILPAASSSQLSQMLPSCISYHLLWYKMMVPGRVEKKRPLQKKGAITTVSFRTVAFRTWISVTSPGIEVRIAKSYGWNPKIPFQCGLSFSTFFLRAAPTQHWRVICNTTQSYGAAPMIYWRAAMEEGNLESPRPTLNQAYSSFGSSLYICHSLKTGRDVFTPLLILVLCHSLARDPVHIVKLGPLTSSLKVRT